MRTILFVAKGIDTGGIISAITPLMNQAIEMGLSIDFLNIGCIPQKIKERWTQGVNWLELPEPTRLQRLIAILKSGMLGEKICTLLDHNRKAAKLGQQIDLQLLKIMPEWPHQYDVAFATGEFLPVYYVAEKVTAKRKFAMLHPRWDLLQLDNQAECPFLEKMDSLLIISEDCKKALEDIYPRFANRLVLLEYSCDARRIQKMAREKDVTYLWKNDFRIVSVCRLDNRSKRIDRMIGTAKILARNNFRFHWVIVGGGPDEAMLHTLISENSLQSYFTLVGSQPNPYPYMAAAQLFVHTSQYEGLCIVVYEAATLQKPMVLTECVNWPQSIRARAVVVANSGKNVCSELAAAIQLQANNKTPPPYNWDDTAQRKLIEKLFT